MTAVEENLQSDNAAMLRAHFDVQRNRYFEQPQPDYAQRKQDLINLKRLVSENVDAIADAISADYGNRSRHETLFAEIISVTDGINDVIKRSKKWMKVQKRHVDQTMFPGGRNRVVPQPLGVVGMIVPWNFPINLSFMPLAAAFAAGNRAMVKMSENSIHLTRLLMELSPKYLPEDKLRFFEETGSVGIEFSKIPFDLLIFTGSGQTGKAVMAAAAQNLTPVVLELGGKAPAVIDRNYNLEKAVGRILFVKQFNAGQICTNVDYVFVHESQREEFIRLAKAYVARHCPDIEHADYTSVIDGRSMQRLAATLEDAREKGATIVNLSADQSINYETRKFPMHLVLDTTDDMQIRHRETFGPLLKVITYQDHEEVVAHINRYDRPLALYPFTNDRGLQDLYIERVMSGGVTVNDALFHVAQHDIPFGGVGPSGMGHYHGKEGFETFSKMRPIYYQPGFSTLQFLRPPYGRFATRVFNLLVKLKS